MSKNIQLTGALLERCLNKGCRVYAALKVTDPEAAEAIKQNPDRREFMDSFGVWCPDNTRDVEPQSLAYRLSPGTGPNAGWTDLPVFSQDGAYRYQRPEGAGSATLTYALNDTMFLGYVYPVPYRGTDPLLLQRLDLAYGVPTHVRFRVCLEAPPAPGREGLLRVAETNHLDQKAMEYLLGFLAAAALLALPVILKILAEPAF